MKIDKLYSLKVSSCSSIKKFIKFWARFYNYSENNKYEDNIRVKQFREGNLLELFDWKNGMI